MNALTQFSGGAAPTVFNGFQTQADEFGGGVSSGFGVLSFRGKVWRVKYQGEEKVIPRRDSPREPATSLEVVILRGNPGVSKIFYEKKFTEGDDNPPDCWSVNGVKPEAGVPKKQSEACLTCRWNQFGSRITEDGKKAKACSDNRRLAVVPVDMSGANDPSVLENEVWGGPMLLRVPPSSLRELKQFDQKLRAQGVPAMCAVAVRIYFDPQAAFPKLQFEALRWLTQQEAETVLGLRQDERTEYILTQASDQFGGGEPAGEDTPAPAPALAGAPPAAFANMAPDPVPVTPPAAPVTPPPPPPPPVEQAAPPPPPAPEPEPAWQFTPDGKHRWKPGMAAWEPVPAEPVAPPPPAVPPAPPPAPAAETEKPATKRRAAAAAAQPETQAAPPPKADDAPPADPVVAPTSEALDNELANLLG